MHFRRLLILLACLLIPFIRAEPLKIPSGGLDLLEAPRPAEWALHGEGAQGSVVDAEGGAFTSAFSADTQRKPDHHYQQQLLLDSQGAVEKGDALLVTFWARATRTSDESGVGRLSVYFQKASAPWGKSVYRQVTLGEEWKFYSFPGVAKEGLAAGEASLGMGFGFKPQTVEVAQIRVRNFGDRVPLDALPETVNRIVYAGMEADAPWRKAAAERIEQHRKAEMRIQVVDASGAALSGARVQVVQKRHAYAFGSAVVAKNLAGDTAEDRQYQEIVENLFNWIVFENDLKFGPWRAGRASWAKEDAMFYYPNLVKAMTWLEQRKIRMRGHTLLWGPLQEKGYYRGLSFTENPVAARQTLEAHIRELLAESKGRVMEWDVLNHPVADFGDDGQRLDHIYGPEFYAEILRLTRKLNPELTLYVNEGSIMPRGNYRDAYEQQIASLVEAGAAPDGIGFMCHFGETSLTGMEELYAVLERFGKFGVPLLATELDVNTKDEEGQAAYLRDMMTLWFSHPQTSGIIMWGFWEGRHWRPDAALYRKDFSPKPAALAWIDLVKQQWWTREELLTNEQGQASLRGFLGDYELAVWLHEAMEPVQRSRFELNAMGTDIHIRLAE